jgi:DNA-binding LacI/PurR family transcriptional regulator
MSTLSKHVGSRRTGTLYRRVADDIRARITGGEWTVGERLPAIPELCEIYQVSDITIRGALRYLTAQGVLETRPRSGVFVRSGQREPDGIEGHRVIAFVATAVQNPFFAEIIHGLEEECHRAGFRLLVANSGNRVEREVQHLQELVHKVAGMVIAPVTGRDHQQEYIALERLGVPFVFVDRRVEGIGAPLIASDNVQGAREATRHLIETGRTDLVVVAGPHVTSICERISGIKMEFAEHGLVLEPTHILSAARDDVASAYHVLKKWLVKNRPQTPFALFALNDLYARASYLVLRELGLRIPQDVAVVGFDDISGVFLDPPMTTVAQATIEMGRRAAKTLLTQIKATATVKEPPPEVRLKPTFIIRNSTDLTEHFSSVEYFTQIEAMKSEDSSPKENVSQP